MSVTVSSDFADEKAIDATLSRLVAVANNTSRAFTGFIDMPAGSDWVAGMSAKAVIAVPGSDAAMIWVPRSALKQHPDGGRSVFAVINNQAKRYHVQVVEQRGDNVAIKGVPGNPALVVSGVETTWLPI